MYSCTGGQLSGARLLQGAKARMPWGTPLALVPLPGTMQTEIWDSGTAMDGGMSRLPAVPADDGVP